MAAPPVEVRGLEMRHRGRLIQEGIDFVVPQGCIFAVMGGSGTGKSTLLRHLVGLQPPAAGQVLLGGTDYWAADDATRSALRARCGMLFQGGALWSSMTLLENVLLPLELLTPLGAEAREARAREVLSWVGLADAAARTPSELSGGMRKRAGLARAIVHQPPLLLLDEPSAGLDPIASRRLDELVLDLRARTGVTVVLVSHELESLMAIADDGIFLDGESSRPIGHGSPRALRESASHPTVRAFMRRESLPVTPPAGVRA
jgi:phospholipid/cholesterol/gamma-HCH transport system ATP-binding protein